MPGNSCAKLALTSSKLLPIVAKCCFACALRKSCVVFPKHAPPWIAELSPEDGILLGFNRRRGSTGSKRAQVVSTKKGRDLVPSLELIPLFGS